MENEQNLTIKERREQKRQEKLQRKEAGQSHEKKSRLFLWGGVALMLIAIAFGITKLVQSNASVPPIDTSVTILDSVNSSDWIRGNAEASTTLVEYGDFECPACGQFYPVLKQLETQFGSEVRFVFRNYPLAQHANARIAARAAEAAGVQGKFFEMHDMLYENQDAWSTNADAKNIFIEYATTLGLNIDKFKKDFESKEIGAKIDEDVQSGNLYGVDATPSFYLDNTKLSPRSFEEFKQLIQNEVAKNS